EVAFDHLLQRSFDTRLDRFGEFQEVWSERAALPECAPRGNLGPNQQSHLVRDVQVERVWRLDMAPQAVQPQLASCAKLIAQKDRRWDGIDSIGIEILVERSQQIDRLAIQQKLAVEECKGAHPKAHSNLGVVQDAGSSIEMGSVDTPKMWLVDL